MLWRAMRILRRTGEAPPAPRRGHRGLPAGPATGPDFSRPAIRRTAPAIRAKEQARPSVLRRLALGFLPGGKLPPLPRPIGALATTMSAMLSRSKRLVRRDEAAAATAPPPHLARLTGVVEAAARHGERAQSCHDDASLRIDSALYELEQLRRELESVVPSELLQRAHEILADAARAPNAQPSESEPALKAGPVVTAQSAA